jgi:hypothetical protein
MASTNAEKQRGYRGEKKVRVSLEETKKIRRRFDCWERSTLATKDIENKIRKLEE